MKDAEARHSSTVEDWTRHCAGLTAETSLLKGALPAPSQPLDPKELEERKLVQQANSAVGTDSGGNCGANY